MSKSYRKYAISFFKAKSWDDALHQILASKSVPQCVKNDLKITKNTKAYRYVYSDGNPYLEWEKDDVIIHLFRYKNKYYYALNVYDNSFPFRVLYLYTNKLDIPNIILPPSFERKPIAEHDKELLKYNVESTYSYDKKGFIVAYNNGDIRSCTIDSGDESVISTHTHPIYWFDKPNHKDIINKIKIGAPASKDDLHHFRLPNTKEIRILYKNGLTQIINRTPNFNVKDLKRMTTEMMKVYRKLEDSLNNHLHNNSKDITVKYLSEHVTKIFNQMSEVLEKYGLKVTYRLLNGHIVTRMKPQYTL